MDSKTRIGKASHYPENLDMIVCIERIFEASGKRLRYHLIEHGFRNEKKMQMKHGENLKYKMKLRQIQQTMKDTARRRGLKMVVGLIMLITGGEFVAETN